MNVSENLEIWTAGACYPDGTGSWGWIARAGERELKRSGLIASTTTCNRAEMSAVLKAMASLHGQKDQLLFKNVTIYTANSYAVGEGRHVIRRPSILICIGKSDEEGLVGNS